METKRLYVLGDEWIYLKIYSGYKSVEDAFVNNISKLVIQFTAEGLVDKWFFIRYIDSDYHIRLRLHLLSEDGLKEVLLRLKELLLPLMENGTVKKVLYDTYEREVERYGYSSIDNSETIFYYGSEAIVQILSLLQCEQEALVEQIKWQLTLKIMDNLLDGFNLDLHDKFNFSKAMKNAYFEEFKFDNSHGKLQMKEKYRKHKKAVEEILLKNNRENNSELFASLFFIVEKMTKKIEVISKLILSTSETNNKQLYDFLASHLHMIVNRMFRTNQRLYEMVLYDFLYNHYRSEIARTKL